MTIRRGFAYTFIACFCIYASNMKHIYAQENVQIRRIEITNYNKMAFTKSIMPDAQRLIGDVQFRHDDITMTCDSAYFHGNTNTLDAFSRVHITQPDGTTVDGDFAKYQGDIKFAEIWGNVVLEDVDATMKTQHLYYDLNTNIAYYMVGAQIFNKGNDMVSQTGYYHRNINKFYFKKEVVLHTPDYTILTDTLDYNVLTKVADFVGPTRIVNEKDTIFCELGWYNTNDTVALFRKNAWIKSGSTTVNADTLYYESISGNGRAFGNIRITDTANDIILHGHKGEYNNMTEKGWLTREAMLVMAGKEDSLFLHADTLRSAVDTTGFKITTAYNKVKFFSKDMQGMCDSLSMSLYDSVIRMYQMPVLWMQDNQMTADYIEIETEKQQPKRMNLLDKAFIAFEEDTVGFNQIRGKKIVGLFRGENELYRINVHDNSESVYFVKDGDFITGVNKAAGPDIVIRLENKQVQEITYIGATEGATIPPIEFNSSELTLTGFNWWAKHQPRDKHEIFRWGEREDISDNGETTKMSVSSSETIDSLRHKINLLINGKQARVGVAVMGSKNKDTLTVNGNTYFPMASVYKYHIALALLRMVDFGTLKLNQKIRADKEDLHPDTHSPLRDDYPNGNANLTLLDMMTYMVSKSDNNACDILLKLLKGTTRTEQIVKSMGVADCFIASTEQEMHADSSKTVLNRTTPLSALKALEIQRRQDVLSENSRNVLWRLMTDAATGNDKIKGKLPAGVSVGHKSGSSGKNSAGVSVTNNDIGIVELPDKQYCIIAVFIADSQEDDKTDAALIADIARLTWDFYRQ